MIEYASASLVGVEYKTDTDSAPRSLVFGSDSWARDNATYATANALRILPYDVYLAEIERSWTPEAVNIQRVDPLARKHNESTEAYQIRVMAHYNEQKALRRANANTLIEYMGTEYESRNDSITYRDDDYSHPMTGLADAEELPIAHSILNHMFGTKGYYGPRFIYRSVTDKWPTRYAHTPSGFVNTSRLCRTRKMMGPNYSFVILSMNK